MDICRLKFTHRSVLESETRLAQNIIFSPTSSYLLAKKKKFILSLSLSPLLPFAHQLNTQIVESQPKRSAGAERHQKDFLPA